MNLLLLMIMCAGLLSCSEHRLYRKIGRQFDGQDTVTVRMVDIIRQDWDTMYVFRPMTHYSGIEHYQEKPYYHDIGRRIVFVKDSKVVFWEDEIVVEGQYSIVFDNDSYFFTKGTAVFRAVKITEGTTNKHIELHRFNH